MHITSLWPGTPCASTRRKRCIIRNSLPAVVGCKNSINSKGDLAIGFGHGRPRRQSPRLRYTRGPWKLVPEVLGLGDDGLPLIPLPGRINDREMEETLFGSPGDECCDASPPAAPIEASEAGAALFSSSGDESGSGSEGSEDIPPLVSVGAANYLDDVERAWATLAPMPSDNYL